MNTLDKVIISIVSVMLLVVVGIKESNASDVYTLPVYVPPPPHTVRIEVPVITNCTTVGEYTTCTAY